MVEFLTTAKDEKICFVCVGGWVESTRGPGEGGKASASVAGDKSPGLEAGVLQPGPGSGRIDLTF
jgi:hypothetical protein